MRAVCIGWLFLAGCVSSGSDPIGQPQWVVQDSGCTASLRGLAVVSPDVAWASGANGTVCRTTDGGVTWQTTVVPGAEELDLRSIAAFDAERALFFTAGTPARLYRTDDGGASFRLVYECELEGAFFDALRFRDQHRGIAFSDPVDGAFLILTSQDGGASWSRLPRAVLPAPLEGEAGFAASNSGVCVMGATTWIGTGGGARPRVFASSDHGGTWRVADVPLRGGTASRGVFSLDFWDERNGVAVGGDYTAPDAVGGTAAYTRDGGATWSASRSLPGGYRSAVAVVPGHDGRVAFAIGPNGCDVTTDGGRTWSQVGNLGFHTIGFTPDGSAGWASGSEGRIARIELAPR